MQLNFGERNKVIFISEGEFYEALGYLSNPQRGIRFDWESYDNKWGIEGRIWITNSSNAPRALRVAFSAGTEYVDNRLNCNEYIRFLISNHGFNTITNVRNTHLTMIRSTVPQRYLSDFDRGYNL